MTSHKQHGRQVESLEKLLVYLLGVAPHEFGLVPDLDGWFALKEVLAAVRGEDGYRGVTEGRILEIHRRPGGASPLEMDDRRVRLKDAAAGWDPEEEGGPPPTPKILHLAVKPSTWPHAALNGLSARPGERGLKLFADQAAALKVAGRLWPDPVAASVQTRQAEAGGAKITHHAGGIWLCQELKPEWLSGPPAPPKAEAPSGAKAAKAGPKAEPGLPGAAAELYAGPPAQDGAASKGKKRGKYGDSPDWKTRTRLDRRKDRGQ